MKRSAQRGGNPQPSNGRERMSIAHIAQPCGRDAVIAVKSIKLHVDSPIWFGLLAAVPPTSNPSDLVWGQGIASHFTFCLLLVHKTMKTRGFTHKIWPPFFPRAAPCGGCSLYYINILDDWNDGRNFVPAKDARVFFAAWNGEAINPHSYKDFESLLLLLKSRLVD